MRSIVGILSASSTYTIPQELEYATARLCCTIKPAIVDVGCGRGDKTFYIASHLKDVQGFVIGVDLDPKLVTMAKSLSKRVQVEHVTDFVQADAHLLPFRSNAFTLALAWNLLMFVYSDFIVVNELRRILRDRGIILISVYKVKHCYRNYDLAKLIRLITPMFTPLSIRTPVREQIVVTALKPSTRNFKRVKLDKALLKLIVENLGIELNDDQEAYIIILDRSRRSTKNDGKEINPFISKKLYAVLLTYFYSNIPKLKHVVFEVLKKRKCIFNYIEIIELLKLCGVPMTTISKAINDLSRLGLLRPATIFNEVIDLCEYAPSLNMLKEPLSLNPVIYLSINRFAEHDNMQMLMALSLVTGNPIVRNAFGRALEVEGRLITVQTLIDSLSELIERYWCKCMHYRIVAQELKELKQIKDRNILMERLLRPLSTMKLLKVHDDVIELSPAFIKALSFIMY